MKKITMALAVALLLPACEREDDNLTARVDAPKDSMQQVTITFDIPQMMMESMTRGALTDANLTDLWFFDFIEGNLVQTKHQQSTDDNFGTVSVTADTGDHQFCFVASRGTNPTITDGEITWEKPSDTFWQKVTMTVTPQTATAQSVELQRVATRLRITVTDEVPANLSKLSITADTWHCGLDALTGEPTASIGRTATINVPSSYAGTTGQLTASIFGLCLDDYTTDVTVSAIDAENATIANVSLEDVPMSRNTTTTYSGPLFTRQPTFSMTVADTWNDDISATW